MTEAATTLDPIVVSIDIHVSAQAVWDEITKTGGIQRPLYNCVMESELRPGARLRYYSPDKKRVFVVGEVLAVDPPRTFKHTYHFMMNGGIRVVNRGFDEARKEWRAAEGKAYFTALRPHKNDLGPDKMNAAWSNLTK